MANYDFDQYMADNFGFKNSAANDYWGTDSYDPASSYSGRTTGNAYAGGTNGSSYAGWIGTNPLSGNNAFSGNQGSLGYGPNPNYDPRMGMKDNASHLGQSSPMGGGGGGGGGNRPPLQGRVEQDEYRPYGTGTAWGPGGGAQKYGGGVADDMIAARQHQQSGTLIGDRGVDYHSAFSPDLPANNDPNAGNRPTGGDSRPAWNSQPQAPSGQDGPTLPPFSGGGKNFDDYSKMGGSSNDLNNNMGRQAETYYDPSTYRPEMGNPMHHDPYQQVDNGQFGRFDQSYDSSTPGTYYPSSIADGQIGAYYDGLPAWSGANNYDPNAAVAYDDGGW